MSELPGNTHQLLGNLVAKIEALEKRMDRTDRIECQRAEARDKTIKKILDDVEELKAYMIENKGGWRMLLFIVTAAGGAGAFLTDIIQRYITTK